MELGIYTIPQKKAYKHSEGKLYVFTPIKIQGEFSQVEERFKRMRQLPIIKRKLNNLLPSQVNNASIYF